MLLELKYPRTGGYKFVPNDKASALAICELESVLSLRERPTISTGPRASSASWYVLEAIIDIQPIVQVSTSPRYDCSSASRN